MLGNLLYTSHAVSFGNIFVNGNTTFSGLASTSVTNANVAENNSPIPADRVYFRYNFFDNGQSVTGVSGTIVPLVVNGVPHPGFNTALSQTKNYDVNLYTFGGEKTFLDGLMSAEVRIPVISTLASKNTFSVGDFAGFTGSGADFAGNPNFASNPTPQNTLGHEDVEFGNMSVVLKSLLYTNQRSGLAISGGLNIGIPTGENIQTDIHDFSEEENSAMLTIQRDRDVQIANNTWALAPFAAALWAPNDRFFTQGFMSVEVPLNASRINYSESFLIGNLVPGPGPTNVATNFSNGGLAPPFSQKFYIREQTLLHLDLGTGFWVYREPDNRWLTGIAPSAEVHYTSTLNHAQQVQLAGDAEENVFNQAGKLVPEIGPVVGGGQPSTMNIVDLTLGTTFQFGAT